MEGKVKRMLLFAIVAATPALAQDANYQQCIAPIKQQTQNPFFNLQYAFSSPDVQAQMHFAVRQRIERCKAIYCAEHPCRTGSR
jgi:hypothetical protein